MGRQEIDVTARSVAGVETVYALLRAGATWPTWSGLDSFELERAVPPVDGNGAGDGGPGAHEEVGAIRVFRTGPMTSREEIVELVSARRLSYVLLSGLPLRDYRADVDLTPTLEGTTIRWHSTFEAKVPGTGWFYRLFLGRFIRQTAEGLAAYAGKQSTTD
ncbi:SRPBCC family protein [Micromonospora sp. NBC_01796]|uniref:SRPBCC family protein n=1 Tax=Micromonospora sp. NBC_01796 TaxID=2975987 RepID=UPI002DD99F66|nr:SRPBCC family protein [Micromonospora sp. NBC_01796]WSA87378.1 SRPBCC family protein [Micromonospora sp. NBC_01796]